MDYNNCILERNNKQIKKTKRFFYYKDVFFIKNCYTTVMDGKDNAYIVNYESLLQINDCDK